MSDNFHDLFKQSVPEAPPTQGWVEGARRKRRARHLVAGGAAALAVIGLAVPLALNLPETGRPVVASPAPVLTPTTPAPEDSVEPTVDPRPTQPGVEVSLSPTDDGRPGAAACYNEAGEPIMDWINIGTIPTGAARAWLCTNPQFYGTAGPLEPLVTDVDGLVEALYAQPEVSDESAQEAAEVYTVVFEFGDGRRMSFTGDAQDSTLLTDGENRLQGSVAFFEDEIAARWEAQRDAFGRPVGNHSSAQACPVTFNQALFAVQLDEIVGGYGCALEAGEPTKSFQLPQSVAARIGTQAAAEAVPDARGEPGPPSETAGSDIARQRTLVLRDVWGDEIRLERRGDSYEFRGDDSLMRWTPSPELAAELDALFDG